MRNPVVHRALRLVAEAVGAVPWTLYDGARDLVGHPLEALIARPNPRQSFATFLEALAGHLLLSGNAYVEHLPLPSGAAELHLLRPDRVRVEADGEGWPAALTVTAEKSKRIVALYAAGEAPSALHIAQFHPLDDHYGFGVLEAALMALDTHNAASVWNKALLDNSARPSGALVYQSKEGGNLSDEQFTRLKGELESEYAGTARAGRPLLLDGGLDWKAMSLSPKDMDFIEAKNAASRDIALAFGVPPMLLGIPGDNTYANYREANRAFHRQTVLPLANRIAAEFSNWLAPAHGAGLRFVPDADATDALAIEREAVWARVGAADFLTEDEKRAAVGYGPRDAKENNA
jgi:HK97 family phage portal protein